MSDDWWLIDQGDCRRVDVVLTVKNRLNISEWKDEEWWLIKMTIDVSDTGMALTVEMDFMIGGESGIKGLGWIQMIYISPKVTMIWAGPTHAWVIDEERRGATRSEERRVGEFHSHARPSAARRNNDNFDQKNGHFAGLVSQLYWC
jgi:hypothetical protein